MKEDSKTKSKKERKKKNLSQEEREECERQQILEKEETFIIRTQCKKKQHFSLINKFIFATSFGICKEDLFGNTVGLFGSTVGTLTGKLASWLGLVK